MFRRFLPRCRPAVWVSVPWPPRPRRRRHTSPSSRARRDHARRRPRSRRLPTRRWSWATSCAPTTAAPRSCSATARRCIWTSARPSTSTATPFSGCSTGRVIVLAEPGAAGSLQIDAPPASVRDPVDARRCTSRSSTISGKRDACRSAVVRGLVDVDSGGGPVAGARRPAGVRAGGRIAQLSGALQLGAARRLRPLVAGAARWRAAARPRRSTCPPTCASTGRRSIRYGSWNYDAPYGYVWYPRVAATWRPYYHGRWRHAGRYGWTFVGADPWGWATHHYGRWGLNAGGAWYWIPSAGLGRGVGALGGRAGLRRLVPARVEQPPGAGLLGPRIAIGVRRRYGHGGHDPGARGRSCRPTRSAAARLCHHERFDARSFSGPRAPTFVVQPTPPSVAIPRGSVVAPGYRIAGPSVAPRAGQSRRGPPLSDAGSASRTPAPASAALRARSAQRRRRLARPTVIYHRGTPIEPQTGGSSSPASAYERAGVAVPRGLPADRGAVPDPPVPTRARDTATRLLQPRRTAGPRRRTRAVDRMPPIRVPLDRGPRTTPTTPCHEAAIGPARRRAGRRSARSIVRPNNPHRARRNRRGIRRPIASRGSQGEAPRATPRSAPSPRAEGPPSRGQSAPAGRGRVRTADPRRALRCDGASFLQGRRTGEGRRTRDED